MLYRLRFQYFGRIISPFAFGFLQKSWKTDSDKCVGFLATLFNENWTDVFYTLPHGFKSNSLIRFSSTDLFESVSETWTQDIGTEIICLIENVEIDANDHNETVRLIGLLHSYTNIISCMHVSQDMVVSVLDKQFKKILCLLRTTHSVEVQNEFVTGQTHALLKGIMGHFLSKISQFARNSRNVDLILHLWPMVRDALHHSVNSISMLRGTADFIETVRGSSKPMEMDSFSSSELNLVFLILQDNIGSYNSSIRFETLRILSLFDQPDLVTNATSNLTGPCPLFQYCIELENLPHEMNVSREKDIVLRRINSLNQSKTMPAMYNSVIPNYCMSLFAINFSLIWPQASTTLAGCSEMTGFWQIFYKRWCELANQNYSNIPDFSLKEEDPASDFKQQNEKTKKTEVRKVSFSDHNLEHGKNVWNELCRNNDVPVRYAITRFAQVTQT